MWSLYFSNFVVLWPVITARRAIADISYACESRATFDTRTPALSIADNQSFVHTIHWIIHHSVLMVRWVRCCISIDNSFESLQNVPRNMKGYICSRATRDSQMYSDGLSGEAIEYLQLMHLKLDREIYFTRDPFINWCAFVGGRPSFFHARDIYRRHGPKNRCSIPFSCGGYRHKKEVRLTCIMSHHTWFATNNIFGI